MAVPFDPYHKWLGISPKDQPPDHYRLLAVDRFESDPDVIESAADKQMGHIRSFQTGKHSDLSQEILNEIAGARVCLLNPNKKEEYDRRLRQKALPPVTTPVTAPPLVANQGSHSEPPPHLSPFHPRSSTERETPSWQVLAAVAAAVVAISLAAVLLVMSGTPPDEDRQDIAEASEPEESPVDSSGPPTPPVSVETVESPAKPEVDPFQDPTTLADEPELVEDPTDTPPAEVSPEPLPSEKPDPPEAPPEESEPPTPIQVTVEESARRLREEFSRGETPDDFKRSVEAGLVLSDRAVVEGSIELARELAAFALAAARRSGNSGLARMATLRVLESRKPLKPGCDIDASSLFPEWASELATGTKTLHGRFLQDG